MKNCCPTHCPLTGAYLKRFLPAVLAAFVFIYAYDFALHVGLLMDTYKTTPQLWRTDADMQSKFGYMLATQFLMAFITGVIFIKNYENKGVGEGLRYGILIGLMIGILNAQPYAWMPITKYLALAWFFGGLVKGVGIGAVYGLIYRDPKCCDKTKTCATGS